MKTLIYVIAIVGLLALPVMAQETKVGMDFTGTRLAAGWMDNGKAGSGTTASGPNNQGSFVIPDVKVMTTMKLDDDTSAVIRLNFDDGAANGLDYAYMKLDNLVNKIGNTKSPFNPTIIIGKHRVDFGEETYSANPVEGALITNSIMDTSMLDIGIQMKQDLPINSLPFMLAASLSFVNGNDGANGMDDNNTKGHVEKVMATFKDQPIYVSLSNYGSGKEALTHGYTKLFELDARYDLLDGKKFDPSKAPLYADAKGVFRLIYGQESSSNGVPADRMANTYMAIDGIYNINNKWYIAARISNISEKWNKANGRTNPGTFSRTAIGGGYRLNDKSMIKLTYTMNAEPSAFKVNNDQIGLLFTTKW